MLLLRNVFYLFHIFQPQTMKMADRKRHQECGTGSVEIVECASCCTGN